MLLVKMCSGKGIRAYWESRICATERRWRCGRFAGVRPVNGWRDSCCGFRAAAHGRSFDVPRGRRRGRRLRAAAGGVAADPAGLIGADGAHPEGVRLAVAHGLGEGPLLCGRPAAAVKAVLIARNRPPVAAWLSPRPGNGPVSHTAAAAAGDIRCEGEPVRVHRIGRRAGVAGTGAARGNGPHRHGGGSAVGCGHHSPSSGDIPGTAS